MFAWVAVRSSMRSRAQCWIIEAAVWDHEVVGSIVAVADLTSQSLVAPTDVATLRVHVQPDLDVTPDLGCHNPVLIP